MSLNEEQIERYSRQILLPQVGGKGQEKLLVAKVLITGAGGLGSPVASYLAGAGVGTLGIVDSDAVELSNLHRQMIYSSDDIGKMKAIVAQSRLQRVNPDVKVVPHVLRLNSENIMEVIKDYDIVVDGTDNFPTRYLINDAFVLATKTLVFGAFFRYEGQAMVIKPGEGPCIRCMFPGPPPSWINPFVPGSRGFRCLSRYNSLDTGNRDFEAYSGNWRTADRQINFIRRPGNGFNKVEC